MAIAAGVAIPAHTILLGQVINNFAYHSIVTRENANISLSIVAQSLALSLNTTCTELVEEDPLLILNIAEGNSSILLCSNQGQEVFQNVLENVCDPASQLQLEIGRLCLYYAAVASGLLVSYFLASVFWNVSAFRQTRRIREAFFWSILRQDIAWFDLNEANGLNTQLSK